MYRFNSANLYIPVSPHTWTIKFYKFRLVLENRFMAAANRCGV